MGARIQRRPLAAVLLSNHDLGTGWTWAEESHDSDLQANPTEFCNGSLDSDSLRVERAAAAGHDGLGNVVEERLTRYVSGGAAGMALTDVDQALRHCSSYEMRQDGASYHVLIQDVRSQPEQVAAVITVAGGDAAAHEHVLFRVLGGTVVGLTVVSSDEAAATALLSRALNAALTRLQEAR